MEKKTVGYLALILLIIGIIGYVMYMLSRGNMVLIIIALAFIVIGFIGSALGLLWWAILRRTESLSKY